MRVIVRNPSKKFNHLRKVVLDRENKVNQFYQFHQKRLASPMLDVKVAKEKYIRQVDLENVIFVR